MTKNQSNTEPAEIIVLGEAVVSKFTSSATLVSLVYQLYTKKGSAATTDLRDMLDELNALATVLKETSIKERANVVTKYTDELMEKMKNATNRSSELFSLAWVAAMLSLNRLPRLSLPKLRLSPRFLQAKILLFNCSNARLQFLKLSTPPCSTLSTAKTAWLSLRLWKMILKQIFLPQ